MNRKLLFRNQREIEVEKDNKGVKTKAGGYSPPPPPPGTFDFKYSLRRALSYSHVDKYALHKLNRILFTCELNTYVTLQLHRVKSVTLQKARRTPGEIRQKANKVSGKTKEFQDE